MKKTLTLVTLVLSVLAVNVSAVTNNWTCPLAGRYNNVNYPWQSSTPYNDLDGAKWHCMDQMNDNPTLTSTYSNMYYQGALYGWVGHSVFDAYPGTQNDPYPRFVINILYTQPPSSFPGTGPAAVLAFEAPEDCKYAYDISGTNIGNNTESAGYAELEIYQLSADKLSATLLHSYRLNKPGGYGGYPDFFSANGELMLNAGDYIAMRIQSVAPGTANPGNVSIKNVLFNVTRKPPLGTSIIIK